MDVSDPCMETPLSEDKEEGEISQWEDVSVSGSDVSQLIDELDGEFEKLKNVKSTSVALNERYEMEMDRIHSLQVAKQYQEAKNACEALLGGELRHRCENAEFWIQFAHIEESIGTPDSVVEVYDRGCACLRCLPSELLTLSLDMRSYVESVLDEEETVEVLDLSQDELDRVAREEQECGSVEQEGERRGKESSSPGRIPEKDSDVKPKKSIMKRRVTHKRERMLPRRTKKQESSSDSESSTTVLPSLDSTSPDADSECETSESQHSPYRSRGLREERTSFPVRKSPRLHSRIDYGKML